VQGRGWRKDGRKRVERLYIAAIVEGKGSRGMEAGVDGATKCAAAAECRSACERFKGECSAAGAFTVTVHQTSY
jgi:hypothetical protein